MSELTDALRGAGHVFLPAARTRARLDSFGGVDDWQDFAASWERLPLDTYMADGGRYRRRRHAVFSLGADGEPRLQAHQPHYQSREYNPLNGGIARWFEPLEAGIANGRSLRTLIRFGGAVFSALASPHIHWRIEAHPFRIEARADADGLPTPEGMHRDGVDYVMVLLVRRHNIASGVTMLEGPDGRRLGSFTLTTPFDAVLLDDRRILHGVTPVRPLDAAQPAFRDVLVLTYRAETGAG